MRVFWLGDRDLPLSFTDDNRRPSVYSYTYLIWLTPARQQPERRELTFVKRFIAIHAEPHGYKQMWLQLTLFTPFSVQVTELGHEMGVQWGES